MDNSHHTSGAAIAGDRSTETAELLDALVSRALAEFPYESLDWSSPDGVALQFDGEKWNIVDIIDRTMTAQPGDSISPPW